MVLQPSEPRITIAGVEQLRRPAVDLSGSSGLDLFQDLHIAGTVTRTDSAARYAGGTCDGSSNAVSCTRDVSAGGWGSPTSPLC